MRAIWLVAGVGAALVYGLGLRLDVMEIDAAEYAAVAREMFETGTWLQPTNRGEPYLDKPPLIFWVARASFELFGPSSFAYRLPSLLIFLGGLYSTYRLASHYAGRLAGRLSALVLATCQGAFLMVQDVRTDTLLTGLVAFALWRAAVALDHPSVRAAALLGVGIGLGMLAKGPIALMAVTLGVAAHIAGRRDWRRLRDPRWLWTAAAALGLLAPMAYGLLAQHGWEGIRFQLWTQGLGRVLDENIWGDAHGPLFFVPQMIWTFLPWTVFLAVALWERLRDLHAAGWRLVGQEAEGGSDRPRRSVRREALTTGAFVLTFIGLSLSRSKLPHYIYVTLPAAAVITGTWLAARLAGDAVQPGRAGATGRDRRPLVLVQLAVLGLMWAFVVGLVAWAFPPGPGPVARMFALVLVGAAVCVVGFVLRRPPATSASAVVLASTVTIVAANSVLYAHVAPSLLAFQATTAAGRSIPDLDPDPIAVIAHRTGGRALDFETGRIVITSPDPDSLRSVLAGVPVGSAATEAGNVWVFTNERGRAELGEAGLRFEEVERYRHYRVSKVSWRFLDPRTRAEATSARFLLRLTADPD